MGIRSPYVAGQFYPANAKDLESFIKLVTQHQASQDAVAIMVPHAGYIYSGKTAAKTIASVRIPDSVLLLGPNHTGEGRPFSIFSRGEWQTPLGSVPINEALASELLNESPYLEENELAHQFEHSLEVQIPFLQVLNPSVKIVPITISCHEEEVNQEVAHQIAEVLKNKDVLILASSDMTHYESAESASKKDYLAIESIEALNENQLWNVVHQNQISMCGIIPMYITLAASKDLGAKAAELVEYTNSGEVTGDHDSVVGYAGMIIR